MYVYKENTRSLCLFLSFKNKHHVVTERHRSYTRHLIEPWNMHTVRHIFVGIAQLQLRFRIRVRRVVIFIVTSS